MIYAVDKLDWHLIGRKRIADLFIITGMDCQIDGCTGRYLYRRSLLHVFYIICTSIKDANVYLSLIGNNIRTLYPHI
ncbi:MAG: hypothetical protein DRN18_03795 [Thermoplasmata archaeon]|nr:MAG: hypothetical protein DRN18_03795 [Thermoplasmata archaeon]